MKQKDFRNCKHEYIPRTKMGIPSLLPFVCKHCGMGSWYSTVEEERKHEEEFMDRLRRGLKGNDDPELPELKEIKKYLEVGDDR